MSVAEVSIRPLHAEEVEAAQDLIARSFDPQFHRYMTATQRGSAAFLAAFVEWPQLHPDRTYLAAVREEELLAYAEFRHTEPGVSFLSYICVSPQLRGQGVATRLIETYLKSAVDLTTMRLDVFAHNAPALALYRKLGFEEEASTVWWRRPLPALQTSPGGLQFHNWPQALAMQEKYGFCEYQFGFQGENCKVGRLGERVLRCGSVDDFTNDQMLSALREAFPELQEALLIAPEGPSPSAGSEAFNRLLRLSWTVPRRSLETP